MYQNSASIQLDQEKAMKARLSEADCRQIYADLDAKDAAKLDRWKGYFRHAMEADTRATFEERLNLYNSRERPGRGAYFADLVLGLLEKEEHERVPVTNLIAYLGEPDSTSNASDGRVFLY